MSSKLILLIDERDELKDLIAKLPTTKKGNAAKISSLTLRLKAVVEKLNSFGTKHHVVLVQAKYEEVEPGETELQATITTIKDLNIYYTEISPDEAIEYTRLKCPHKITEIMALEVPTGKPVKLFSL